MIELFTLQDGQVLANSMRPMAFPAGEQHVVLESPSVDAEGPTAEPPAHTAEPLADRAAPAPSAPLSPPAPLAVLVRGAGSEDLVAAAMAVDAAHRSGRTATLVLPYLPGARQDRGVPFGAQVYARLIDAVGADRVLAVDPHSPVMPALIARLEIHPLERIVRRALARRVDDAHVTDYVGVIAPDAGAVQRSGAVAAALGLPLFRALKHRDFATGKLSGFTCEELPADGRLLVVDDICDGGGTFAGLAAATGLGPDRLDLWVTHGVFSGRAPQLREHFGTIHTTDSHPGHANPQVGATVHPVTTTLVREALLS